MRLLRVLLATLLLMVAPAVANAAISLVAQSTAGSGTNASATVTINSTGANLLVVYVSHGVFNPITITDSIGGNNNGAPTLVGTHTSSNVAVDVYYFLSPAHVGASHSFTAAGASSFPGIIVDAYSGVSALDKFSGTDNVTTGTASGGALTPTGNNELIVATMGGDGDPGSIDSGFSTPPHHGLIASTSWGIGAAHIIQTTGGAVNPTWTITNSNANAFGSAAVIAAFTASTGAATTYTLSGPSSGTTGSASTNFTVQAVGTPASSVTVTPATSGTGTFSPTTVSLAATLNSSATFTYTPGVSQAATISTTNSGSLTDPSGITYTSSASAATSYTFTPPTPRMGVRGSASGNYTITPVGGNYTGTITITPSGAGLSTPITVTFSGTSAAQTFTITPTTKGVVSLTPTASPTLGTDPPALSYVSLPKVKIVFDGDSLTYGDNATSGQGTVTGTVYPGVVFTQLQGSNSFYSGVNLGTDGRRLDTMLSTEASRIAPEFDATFDDNILVIQGGTNDLGGINDGTHSGIATPAAVWANLITYVANAQGYGFSVIIQTITPAGWSTFPLNFNQTRDVYDDLIRSNWKSTKAVVISDIAADSRIGFDGDELNTTYYSTDKTHHTDLGYAIKAGYAAQAIQAVIDGQTSTAPAGIIVGMLMSPF